MAARQVIPTDGMVLKQSAVLAPGVYYLPNGITIDADHVTLDGGGAVLVGADHDGVAVRIPGRSHVTVKNLRIRDYYHGIYARDGGSLTIANNHITSTAEVPPNTIFLDIWRGPEESYGGAILLWNVGQSSITDNRIQHQQNGLITYHCRHLTVKSNQANYNSGFG